jgi:hypothetical protein
MKGDNCNIWQRLLKNIITVVMILAFTIGGVLLGSLVGAALAAVLAVVGLLFGTWIGIILSNWLINC